MGRYDDAWSGKVTLTKTSRKMKKTGFGSSPWVVRIDGSVYTFAKTKPQGMKILKHIKLKQKRR